MKVELILGALLIILIIGSCKTTDMPQDEVTGIIHLDKEFRK